jgi:hypothetical protein
VTHLIFLLWEWVWRTLLTALDVVGNFSIRNIDLNECLSAFESITSNAVGGDGISFKSLKLLLPLICCHVLHVFNHAKLPLYFLLCGNWLLFGKLPRLAVGTPSSPSDFRPISVVSILSKPFESILHDQLLVHVMI